MLEDKLLVWQFKCGSSEALARIYEKYVSSLLSLAMAVVHNRDLAEDIAHDVFVAFAERVDGFKVTGNLKAFLNACVLNRARDVIKVAQGRKTILERKQIQDQDEQTPEKQCVHNESKTSAHAALAQLPLEQREVVALHQGSNLRLTQIAKLQNISVNTVRGRYRYALQKMRTLLNGELK